MTFQEKVDFLIRLIISHLHTDIPTCGDFVPVIEFFNNPDFSTRNIIGKYGLRVYKMPVEIVADPAIRYVEASAYDPTGTYKATVVVAHGTNKEIITKMSTPEFRINLNKDFGLLLGQMTDL